ncbi:MAG: hypothetical protein ACF8PN_10520 [Phycisphaerales bacterium]
MTDETPSTTGGAERPLESDRDRAVGDGGRAPGADTAANLAYEARARMEASAKGDQPVSFPRQMLQLTVIPALIVAIVMAVWLLVVTLGGQAQSLQAILDRLESVPAGETGSLVDRPGHQERARAAVNLMGYLEDADALPPEQREMLVTRLPQIARLYKGREPQLTQYIMGALGALADPVTLPVFEDMLVSPYESDRAAAAIGLATWQGPTTELRPLVPTIIATLGQTTGDTEIATQIRTLLSLTLGAAADPANDEARAALARVLDRSVAADRESVWNAGVALAALGDERGLPIVRSLLDREWLARQPADPLDPELGLMSDAAQDKVLSSVVNVVIGFDPDRGADGAHFVRIADEGVWNQIEKLATDDPSEPIRAVTEKALKVRDGTDQ